MGPGSDALNIVSSLAKSVEIDRSPGATQRASDIAQDQITGEEAAAASQKKADALEHLRQAKIRQERERRRRELERQARGLPDNEDDENGSEPHLDIVA